MKIYTIRTVHNSSVGRGPAERIVERWEQLKESYTAAQLKIRDEDTKDIVSIDDLVKIAADPQIEEPVVVRNNDDKVWPWDEEKKDDSFDAFEETEEAPPES